MKILSKYKDFYDYLQHIYGQDDNVTWERDFIDKNGKKELPIGEEFYSRHLCYVYCDEWFSIVSVLGEPYVITDTTLPSVRHRSGQERIFGIVTHSMYDRLMRAAFRMWNVRSRYLDIDSFKKVLCEIRENNRDALMKLHRKYRAPILRIKNPFNKRWCRLVNAYEPLTSVPGLVAAVGSPESLYQRIYNFFIETNDNVDLRPPVELSEKDRITEHGFDLKKSFRHPVK